VERSCPRNETLQLQDDDTQQLVGYAEGLKREYPEARVSQFVIYCIGNRGAGI